MTEDQIIITIRKKGAGTKPDYYLELREDGAVFYEGYENVKTLGKVEKDLTKIKFAELLSLIRDFKFFNLDDDYSIVDDPSYPRTIISASIPLKDGSIKSKTVTYFQRDPTIPDELKLIENKIHDVVEFEKWDKSPVEEKEVLPEEEKIEPKVEAKPIDEIIKPKPIEKPIIKPKSSESERKSKKPIITVFGILAIIIILFVAIGILTADNDSENITTSPSISFISSAGEVNGLGDYSIKQDFEHGDVVIIYVEFENFSKINDNYDISIEGNLVIAGEIFREKNYSSLSNNNYLDISFTSDESWPEGAYFLNFTLTDNPSGKTIDASISFNMSKESLKIDVLDTAAYVGGLGDYTSQDSFNQGDTFYVYIEYSNFVVNNSLCNLSMELYITEISGDKEYLAYNTQTNANKIEHHWSVATDVSWNEGEYVFRVKITDNLSSEETNESDNFSNNWIGF